MQSVRTDSDHSEFAIDSAFYNSDDDLLYDENIDQGVEWGGLREKAAVTDEPRRSKRINPSTSKDKGEGVVNA